MVIGVEFNIRLWTQQAAPVGKVRYLVCPVPTPVPQYHGHIRESVVQRHIIRIIPPNIPPLFIQLYL